LHDPSAFEELHGLAAAVLEVVETGGTTNSASAANEWRISAALRFIEANLSEPLPLNQLAAAKRSEFHFLRAFGNVTRVTPTSTSCARRFVSRQLG
jgi:transcriptional regulator GlxA family with amidase domain